MPFKSKEEQTEYFREYHVLNKDKRRVNQRKFLLKQFGLTPEDYENLLIDQDFKCGICSRHVSELKVNLAVDHCHVTQEVRGLLCRTCNASLGQLGDNVESIEKVLNYLKRNQGI